VRQGPCFCPQGMEIAMENKERLKEEKWGLGPGPIVFTGTPASCQGYVELINKSAEDVEPKAIAITGLEGLSAQGRLPEAAKVSVRLRPHQRLRVPIEVALDPTTPPGSYTGQLSCGSQTEDVVINVLEYWDLRIAPQNVTITASPGGRVPLRILFTNLGNTEVTLPKSVSLHLEHNLEINRHLDTALKATGQQGFQKFLDRLVQELAEAAVSAATVQFKPEGTRFHSSETKEVELEIQFPEDLKRNSIYKSTLKFKNARLVLEVECTTVPAASPRRPK